MYQFMSGSIFFGCVMAGLLFTKFGKKTQDRLFSIFGSAFFLLAFERGILAVINTEVEERTFAYFMRLAAFIFIIYAIIDKNRKTSS